MWNCSLPSTSLKCYCAPEAVRSSNTAGAVTRMITTAGITFTDCVSSLPAYPFFRRIVSSSISLLLAYLFFRRCLCCRRIFTAGVSLSPAYLYPRAYLHCRRIFTPGVSFLPAYLYPGISLLPAYLYPGVSLPRHIFTAGVSLPPAYLYLRHIFTSRRIATVGICLVYVSLYFLVVYYNSNSMCRRIESECRSEIQGARFPSQSCFPNSFIFVLHTALANLS